MEYSDYLRFFLALIFVLSLIGLLAWMGRRLGAFPGIPKRRQGEPRLRAVESIPLDARRRVVLVRRDDVEHLILLGPATETIVETGILPPAPSSETAPESDDQDVTGTPD